MVSEIDPNENTQAMPKCGRRGCENPVVPKRRNGGKPKRFCSDKCRVAQWDLDNPRQKRNQTEKGEG